MKRNLIYHTHIPLGDMVSIETSTSSRVKTKIEAISRDGITISCNQSVLAQLLPNTASVAPKQPVSLLVSFDLDQINEEVKANCNVVAVRRLSRDTFQMIMRFRDISEHNFENVDRYIENSLKQRPNNNLQNVA